MSTRPRKNSLFGIGKKQTNETVHKNSHSSLTPFVENSKKANCFCCGKSTKINLELDQSNDDVGSDKIVCKDCHGFFY